MKFNKPFSCKWFSVFEKGSYFFVSRRENPSERKIDAVSIIAKDSENKFLVLNQYRPALEDWVWEFPAGLVDAGETVEQAAVRETKEESGLDLVIEDVIYITVPSPGLSNEIVAIVKGKVTGSLSTDKLEPDEKIVPHLLNTSGLLDLVTGSNVVDSKLAAYVLGRLF